MKILGQTGTHLCIGEVGECVSDVIFVPIDRLT